MPITFHNLIWLVTLRHLIKAPSGWAFKTCQTTILWWCKRWRWMARLNQWFQIIKEKIKIRTWKESIQCKVWLQRQYLVKQRIYFRIRTCNLKPKERFLHLKGRRDLNSLKLWTKITHYPELQDLHWRRKRRNYPKVKSVKNYSLMRMTPWISPFNKD